MTLLLWLLVLAVWWTAGIVGVAYSFASLRRALILRRDEISDRRYADVCLYAAAARMVIFAVPSLGAPIFYNAFRLPGGARFSDVAPTVLPFGVFVLVSLVMTSATIATLILVIIELRALKAEGEGDG